MENLALDAPPRAAILRGVSAVSANTSPPVVQLRRTGARAQLLEIACRAGRKDRPYAEQHASWAVALVPALWIGTHLDGIRGAAVAHGVVAVCVAIPLAVLALRLAGVSLVSTLPALMRPMIGAAISAAGAVTDHVPDETLPM